MSQNKNGKTTYPENKPLKEAVEIPKREDFNDGAITDFHEAEPSLPTKKNK